MAYLLPSSFCCLPLTQSLHGVKLVTGSDNCLQPSLRSSLSKNFAFHAAFLPPVLMCRGGSALEEGTGQSKKGEKSAYAAAKSSDSISSRSFKAIGKALAIALTFLQPALPVPINDAVMNWTVGPAEAVLYSPDTRLPRTAEVALRRAIPAGNSAMKKIEDSLENVLYLLRIPQRKPYGTMGEAVNKALKLAVDERSSILAAVPVEQKDTGSELYESLIHGKEGLQPLVDAIIEKDPDKISFMLASSLDTVVQLELLQAPGLPYLLPGQYQEYPRLTGRATVEFVVEKGDGSTFTVSTGGGPQKVGTVEVVLDGYSAPLTSGNFANLVMEGKYDGMKLRATEQAVLSDNEFDESGSNVPLEIMPAGEFQPLYRATLNVQDGELPVLPLSVYGAVAMAHNPNSENYSASSQFFFYLYDKRSSGLGGLSFDEGQFSVFGYVTNGKELLAQLKTGDIIQSARLVSGADHLVLPINGSS